MRIYKAKDDEDALEAFLKTIEKDTRKIIFTMKVLSHPEDGLETVIVFNDKSVLYGFIKSQEIDGKLALRMQGNWI